MTAGAAVGPASAKAQSNTAQQYHDYAQQRVATEVRGPKVRHPLPVKITGEQGGEQSAGNNACNQHALPAPGERDLLVVRPLLHLWTTQQPSVRADFI